MLKLSNPGILASELSDQPYAWPGGYPKFAVTDDGGALCKECCKVEFNRIKSSYEGDGWYIIGLEINWEEEIYCDNCGLKIESAYGEEK